MREHVFAGAVNSILTDNKYDRFVGNKKRGKINFNDLAKIGYSEKIFKKKEARKNKDYSVLILCDASGSMGESDSYGKSRYDVVAESIEFLTEALGKTPVKFAIWSFAGVVLTVKDFDQEMKGVEASAKYLSHRGDCSVCSHCEIIGMWEDHVCPNCHRMNRTSNASYNCDGLALHLALEEIKTRKGEKIIIVLSDGEADAISFYDWSYMTKDGLTYGKFPIKEVVPKVIKDKVILCSVGIQSEAVKKIYPPANTRVVNNLNQVCEQIIKLIKPKIKRG